MKETIIFKSMTGSRLYGTNSDKSDKDIKGVFLPDIEDLYMCIAPKNYKKSTSNNDARNTRDDVDEEYYSLQYFLQLVSNGETNALDLFFADSNDNTIILTSDLWKKLKENSDKIITCNISKYIGFCKAQVIKYSNKGKKLKDFESLYNFLNKFNNLSKTTIYDIFNENGFLNDLNFNLYSYDNNGFENYIAKYSLNDLKLDMHILKCSNKQNFLMLHGKKFQMNEYISNILLKIKNIIKIYGSRTTDTKDNNCVDYKSLSHAVRVIIQSKELLTTGNITFPFKGSELSLIKDIKYGKIKMSFDEIINFIDKSIADINDLLLTTKVRKTPDYNFIKSFILYAYGLNKEV